MKRTRLLMGSLALAALCVFSDPSRANAGKDATQEMRVDRLFEVRLQYAKGVEAAPLGEREGRLVGGGTGTVDGARINAMTLRFKTDDARYRWLNTTLGVWEGEFDMQTGVSTGRVYTRLDASTP